MLALLSVSNKAGIVEFAKALHELGVQIISTGGTATTLQQAGIPVEKVSSLTGFPEIMDGRVKTLHPNIHGGLLADTDNAVHIEQMNEHGIRKIDIVAVNLYPFENTIAKENVSWDEAIENIDIGGPAMVRASAKNHKHTTIVVNPERYADVLNAIRSQGTVPAELRRMLALEAFSHTAHYDATISGWLAKHVGVTFPKETSIPLRTDQSLRYGENPHQSAVLYGNFTSMFRQLHGKELSYNNILDIDAATMLCVEFEEPAVVIVKHNNPCGVGIADNLVDAYRKAFATDTVSPFGGIIAMNRVVDAAMAAEVHPLFAEVLIAPGYTSEALEILTKKKDRRLVTVELEMLAASTTPNVRSVAGGFLVQERDAALFNNAELRVVSTKQPTDEQRAAMITAWKIAKHVKSNAIVYAAHDRSLAIGAGQMSRVDSARIAASKAADAGIDLSGCAVASDAFFPFADGLLQAAQAGASCVIQPGGSVRDAEVIAAADENGLAMMFTGMRHFRH